MEIMLPIDVVQIKHLFFSQDLYYKAKVYQFTAFNNLRYLLIFMQEVI